MRGRISWLGWTAKMLSDLLVVWLSSPPHCWRALIRSSHAIWLGASSLCLLIAALLGLALLVTIGILDIVLVSSAQGQRSVITVDTFSDELDDGGNDCALREAIQAANTNSAVDGCTAGNGNDTIILPAGTYALTLTGSGEDANLTGDLDINDTHALTITGSGPVQTIINANGIDRVLDIRPGAGAVSISGITIGNGHVINTNGGGIYNEDADLMLADTAIVSNSAANGGGIHVDTYGSVMLAVGAQISSNSATGSWPEGRGGGVYIAGGGHLTLSEGQIVSNTATNYGGGVYIHGWTATFSQTGTSTIAHNSASESGGVYVLDGSATLSEGQVVSNAAGSGGGVYVWWGDATLGAGRISNNSANRGGGVYVANSPASFKQEDMGIIADNSAVRGGGVYVQSGSAEIGGGQIISNSADLNGGAVYVVSGNATLNETYVLHNAAGGNGGGFYLAETTGGITMTNGCIVSNSDLSVDNTAAGKLVVINTWWGSANGPSGIGIGGGDSVSVGVQYEPYEGVPGDCPTLIADLSIIKAVTPATAGPGETITYTLTFANRGPHAAGNVVIADRASVSVTVSDILSRGVGLTQSISGTRYTWSPIVPRLVHNEVGVVTVTGVLNTGLLSEQIFTNTALISTATSESDLTNNAASVPVKVCIPRRTYLPLVLKRIDN